MKELSELEAILGITFKNKKLLREALTHGSYQAENPSWPYQSNKRLEFLGDSVLEFFVTQYLIGTYHEEHVGIRELTRMRVDMVNNRKLSEVAKALRLQNFIFYDSKMKVRAADYTGRVLSNALEAVIGAVFLDKGYEGFQSFFSNTLLPHLVIASSPYSRVINQNPLPHKTLQNPIITQ